MARYYYRSHVIVAEEREYCVMSIYLERVTSLDHGYMLKLFTQTNSLKPSPYVLQPKPPVEEGQEFVSYQEKASKWTFPKIP